jgi:hypothetical protein
MNLVEKYNWFGSRAVHAYTPPGSDVSIGVEVDEPSKWYVTVLKILTMILSGGILSLLALVIKAISRCCSNEIQVVPDPRLTHIGSGAAETFSSQVTDMFAAQRATITALQEQCRRVMDPEVRLIPPSSAIPSAVPTAQQLADQAIAQNEPLIAQELARARVSMCGRGTPPRIDPTLEREGSERLRLLREASEEAYNIYIRAYRARMNLKYQE